MKNKLFLLAAFASLTISISANTNTNELEKFNSAKSTISFTENKGQISDQNYNPRPDVLFSGEANGLTFHIRNNGVSYQTSRVDSWKQQDENLPEGIREEGTTDSVPDQMTIYRTDINWLGFNKDYTIESGESTAGFNNYYLPSCPNGAMNVKSYTDVTFKNLYAGIDVKWYEKNGELEYDFILAPNADYTKISWEIKGADRISIGENGQLIIETPLGNIEEQAPIAFQGETKVEATWKIDGNKISFQLGSYNENEVLIIDPVVRLWGTYYGGTGEEYGLSCATDASGNVYLAGSATSTTGIATTGAHKTTRGGIRDAFLVKFNSSGVRQWGTYYGGTGYLNGNSCATDASGNVYLSGYTTSTTGIATTGAHQATYGSSGDAFLVKFNSSGVRQWGTYYGGTSIDYGYSCATDGSGNVFLAGYTSSTTGIATTGAHQTTRGGSNDAFLVKFNSSGTRQWGTYYGGTGIEIGYSCATDASGNVYLTGEAKSTTGIATTGAHQTSKGSLEDAFLVKFNSSGVRQWGTYYGGTGNDYGYSCATDASGNVYLAGSATSTTGIATTGAHQTTSGGSYDAFLVKFNSSGVRQWGTYYGGTGADWVSSCATDGGGNAYLSGYTESTTGIATTGAHQTTSGGGSYDAFLVKFNSSGVRQWGTYYGGTGIDYGLSCAIGASGSVYLAGYSPSTTGIAAQTTLISQGFASGPTTGWAYTTNPAAFSVGYDIWDKVTTLSGVATMPTEGTHYWGVQDLANSNGGTAAGDSGTINFASYTIPANTNVRVSFDYDVVGYDAGDDVDYEVFENGTSKGIVNLVVGASGGVSSFGTESISIIAGTDSVSIKLYVTQDGGSDYAGFDNFKVTSVPSHQTTYGGGSSDAYLVKFDGCPAVYSQDTITACDSYTWIDGVTYSSSDTTAKDTLVNAAGCDSIVSLFLTINNSTSAIDTITACDSYTWIDGVTYTSSDTSAKHTLVNVLGCDSVVSLKLTINTIDKSVNTSRDTLNAVESGAQYQWLDCGDSYGIIVSETGQSFIASSNGSYAVEITKNGCADTTTCYDINTVGLGNSFVLSKIKVYPNPTSGNLTIDAENYKGVEVYDTSGRLIIKSALNTIDLEEQSKGLYLLKVNANGTTQEFKVFKE